jgi:hypothetical protein
MNRKTLFIIALLVAFLCLLCSPAMGKCQKIRTVEKSCEYPTECDGYEACEICLYEGTPNATVRAYWNESEWTLVGDAIVGSVDAVWETNQGEIWADAEVMIHLGGLLEFDSGLVASVYLYGGTGKYEGTTGWVAGAGVPQKGTLLSWYGEICWPDED